MKAPVGMKIWVVDAYDANEHVGQYVFASEAEAHKAAELIEEGIGSDREDDIQINEYAIESYEVWRKAYDEEGSDVDVEDEDDEERTG